MEGIGTAGAKVALFEGEGGERGVVTLQPIAGTPGGLRLRAPAASITPLRSGSAQTCLD